MTRALGGAALALVAVWVVAHLLYIGPVQAAAEATLVWILSFVVACLVTAALVLLGVGMILGQSRPVWLRFVRAARSAAAVVGSALVLVGLLHYRDTEPRGEIHWLVLGLGVLAGALLVHWWVVRVTRQQAV
ncbi:MAG TPA: hypothetical protein VFV05_22095 [Methylomirabilota bacterium]|nr:hypothetical protein [Methylomirabilota bacterium]